MRGQLIKGFECIAPRLVANAASSKHVAVELDDVARSGDGPRSVRHCERSTDATRTIPTPAGDCARMPPASPDLQVGSCAKGPLLHETWGFRCRPRLRRL